MKSFSFGSSFFARPSFGKWPSDPNASGVSVEDDDDDDVLYEGVIFAWCAQLCSFTVLENHPQKSLILLKYLNLSTKINILVYNL